MGDRVAIHPLQNQRGWKTTHKQVRIALRAHNVTVFNEVSETGLLLAIANTNGARPGRRRKPKQTK